MIETIKFKVTATFLALAAFDGATRLNADTLISTFDENYFENALYASWASSETIIEYGPESYTLTATGYGSNWTYIGDFGILGAGNNHIQLDVTLAGPPAADGHLGPLVQLIDGDGTHYHFRWYGQTLGNHVLTLPIELPSFVTSNGSTPGLDLDALAHMHLELDPGGFGTTGQYTVSWNELSLITVEGTPGDFDDDGDVDGRDFLVWQRGDSTTPLSATDLADWQTNYGADEATLAAVTSVPEPASVWLVACSVALLGRRRLFCMLHSRRSE